MTPGTTTAPGGAPGRAPGRTPDPATTASAGGDVQAVLRALADPQRWRLLGLLRDAGGEACVCDLTAGTDLSQPTVSHHLRALEAAGMLERERRGVWVWYRLRPGPLDDLADRLRDLGTPSPAAAPGRGCA